MTESIPESSVETYDLWQSKPWWCQPWTIILTGIVIITGSWLLFHKIWLSIIVSIPIVVWWIYFLVLVPRLLASSKVR
jgi:hypothetical protein